jgi:hypothetical protein
LNPLQQQTPAALLLTRGDASADAKEFLTRGATRCRSTNTKETSRKEP